MSFLWSLKASSRVGTLLIWLAVTTLLPGSSEGMTASPRYSNFARHLRNTRVKRGLSAAEVADLVGVSSVSIYLWETDHCRPRDRNLTALCRVLRLPIRATREMAG
jgi:DNA-binding XRE family transcriptional regulator